MNDNCIILYYGNNENAIYEGKKLFEKVNENNDFLEAFIKSPKNKIWYDFSVKNLEKNNNEPLPYPSSILLTINEKYKNYPLLISMIPQLSYLLIYTLKNKEIINFIKSKFDDMILI